MTESAAHSAQQMDRFLPRVRSKDLLFIEHLFHCADTGYSLEGVRDHPPRGRVASLVAPTRRPVRPHSLNGFPRSGCLATSQGPRIWPYDTLLAIAHETPCWTWQSGLVLCEKLNRVGERVKIKTTSPCRILSSCSRNFDKKIFCVEWGRREWRLGSLGAGPREEIAVSVALAAETPVRLASRRLSRASGAASRSGRSPRGGSPRSRGTERRRDSFDRRGG